MQILKRLLSALTKPFAKRIRHAWYSRAPERLLAQPDYETYRKTQTAGNRRKLMKVFAREENIAHLARYAVTAIGRRDLRVLCHGTRNGTELQWFRKHMPEAAAVLGTDISDTATQFPDTIQWDFHDLKDEWVGGWDVIYTNSWDHAFEPDRAFRNWMACLSPRGVLFLEHTRDHTPAGVSELDPFGATVSALTDRINRVGSPRWSVVDVVEDLPDRGKRDLRVLVVSASAAPATVD
jgi:hypothetical protein